MGVHSLKIEGHTKSFYYCARTAQVSIVQAIDDAVAGRPFDPTRWAPSRTWPTAATPRASCAVTTTANTRTTTTVTSVSDTQQFVGEITGRNGDMVEVEVKNKFLLGNSLS